MLKKTFVIFLTLFFLLILSMLLLKLSFEGQPLIHMIDYEHYLEAARRITLHISPYQGLEYFAPLWFAVFLVPLTYLSPQIASLVWLLLMVVSLFIAVVAWQRHLAFANSSWRPVVIPILFLIAPPSLYVYITGQSSPLVFLGLTSLLLCAKPSVPRLLISFFLVTIKPHLVVFPLSLYLAESMRQRRWWILWSIGLTLLLLVGVAAWLDPAWFEEWLLALIGGKYRGGPGLVARGYVGLRELGIPVFVLGFPVLYLLWIWHQEGLSPYLLCSSLVANLMVIPYSRAYDYNFLYPAVILILTDSTRGLNRRVLGALLLSAILILPLLLPSVPLPPVLTLMALLLWRVK